MKDLIVLKPSHFSEIARRLVLTLATLFFLTLVGLSASPVLAQESEPATTAQTQEQPATKPTEQTKQSLAGGSSAFSSGYMAQTVIGLVFVIILLFGLLWVMKRAGLSPGHRPNQFYKVIQVSSLGPKEKIALIEVGDTWLVVGMTQQSINTLHTMPKDSLKISNTSTTTSEAFSKMLEKLKTPQAKT